MRKLTAAEVMFERWIEQDETSVEGHFMSGDPEYEQADRDLEASIIERLNGGEVEAWCGVIVEATWKAPDGTTYTGRDSIWGCSLDDSYTQKVVAEEHGLYEGALDDLNRRIADTVRAAKRLESALEG